MQVPDAFIRFTFQHRVGFLLLSLFGMFAIAAFAQHSHYEDEFFLVDMCLIVLASLYTVEKITSHLSMLVFGSAVVGIANIAGYFIPGQEADLIAGAISLLFLIWVIVMLFTNIFSRSIVNQRTIMAAVCLYALMGLAFGFIYLLIDYTTPHSFHLETPSTSFGTDAFLDRFFYYSFTTMTTLGFGDITPVSPPARYFSALEALIAQLYTTILVARLVGLHLTQVKR